MAEKKRADLVMAGEEFEHYTFCVTQEFNQQYLEAVQDYHIRYSDEHDIGKSIVHPSLLLAQSNITKSPSFYLPDGKAAVHSHEEIEYLNPGTVGKSFTVYWKVAETYEKRGRKYQVKETLVVDEDGVEILKRKITDVYLSGRGEGR